MISFCFSIYFEKQIIFFCTVQILGLLFQVIWMLNIPGQNIYKNHLQERNGDVKQYPPEYSFPPQA